MRTEKGMLIGCVAAMGIAGGMVLSVQGGTYTWLASPADGSWNTTSLNWSDGTMEGVAWVENASAPHDAMFGTTSSKSVNIGSSLHVNDLTFTDKNYSFGGSGALVVSGAIIQNASPITFNNVLASGRTDGSLHFTSDNSFWRIVYVYGTANTQTSTYLEGSTLFSPNNDGAFGVVPTAPRDNIFIAGTPTLFASGNFAINSNRIIKISSGKYFNTGVNVGPFTYKCRIVAEPTEGYDYSRNTYVKLYTSWTGLIVFDPGAGRTNAFGRLQASTQLKVASGVTHLTGPGGTGANAHLYVDGNGSDYVNDRGNLMVDGGEIYTHLGSYVDVQKYGQVTVTNGGKVNMPGVQWLNGLGSPARLTIVDGGEVTLSNLRISQSQASEVHLNEGGLLKTLVLSIDPDASPKGTFWFNGGRLQSRDGRANFFGTASTTAITEDKARGITFAVGEKGAVLDTSNGGNLWWTRPLVSGVAHDGGLRKLGAAAGSNVLILMNTNCYNGVTSIEGGGVQLRVDNALPPGTTVRMSGNSPYIDAYTFESESPKRNTEQWLSRVEGYGELRYCPNVHVTNSIAPSLNGTLVIHDACDLRGDYEIAADTNGCGLLDLRGTGQSISNLTLKVQDFSVLDTRAPKSQYKIMNSTKGYAGTFKLPPNWPTGWDVSYTSDAAYLYFHKGTKIVIR